MKLYNHWIKFNNTNGEYARTDETRDSWVSDKVLAQKRLDRDVRDLINPDNGRSVYSADYGIIERNFPEKIITEGKLINSRDDAIVGNKRLYYDIFRMFVDNNIRITIEILEDNPKPNYEKLLKYHTYGNKADLEILRLDEIEFLTFLLDLDNIEEVIICNEFGYNTFFVVVKDPYVGYKKSIRYIEIVKKYFNEKDSIELESIFVGRDNIKEEYLCAIARFRPQCV